MSQMELIHYCVDIGSVNQDSFAWARKSSLINSSIEAGTCIDVLCKKIIADLNVSTKITIGFESPLFIPIPENKEGLGKSRSNERNRAWSAGAGPTVAMLALQEITYIFKKILNNDVKIETCWDQFINDPSIKSIFVWEAFITADSKSKTKIDSHIRDSISGVIEINSRVCELGNNKIKSDVGVGEGLVLSLLGAALIWVNNKYSEHLNKRVIVISPKHPFGDEYDYILQT